VGLQRGDRLEEDIRTRERELQDRGDWNALREEAEEPLEYKNKKYNEMEGGRGRRVKETVDGREDDALRRGREGERRGKREGEGEGGIICRYLTRWAHN